MCIAGRPAHFEQTLIWTGEISTRKQVTAYQNNVMNLSDGPNTMLLHVPAARPLTQAHFFDTSVCPRILEDMRDALFPKRIARGLMSKSFNLPQGIEIFKMGIYEIVAAAHGFLIPEALPFVSEEKRPNLDTSFFMFFGERFKNWPIVLACFNNRDIAKASPIMYEYEPLDPHYLFFPALDAHDGTIPDLRGIVKRDHVLMASSFQMDFDLGTRISFRDAIPTNIKMILPSRVLGIKLVQTVTANGDFRMSVKKAMQGNMAWETQTYT